MKYACDVIQDLLPLYQDKICSNASRIIVEQHISECEVCRKISEQMCDNAVEEKLFEEKNSVIKKHQKEINKRTTVIGIAIGGILFIPTLVCLICNIAIGHAVDWFFIVLASMLLAASFLVVPLVAETKKIMWVVVTSTFSLVLLLLVCCIYTRGNWFFVAAGGSIFGISVVFAPFVIPHLCVGKLERHKAAATVLWDTVWLYLLLIACGIFVHWNKAYWHIAMSFSSYSVLIVWIFVVIISYLKRNGCIKGGILTIATGIWIGLFNDIMNFFLKSVGAADGNGLGNLDLAKGFQADNYKVLNANLLFTIILVSIAIGALLIWYGLALDKKGEKNEIEK